MYIYIYIFTICVICVCTYVYVPACPCLCLCSCSCSIPFLSLSLDLSTHYTLSFHPSSLPHSPISPGFTLVITSFPRNVTFAAYPRISPTWSNPHTPTPVRLLILPPPYSQGSSFLLALKIRDLIYLLSLFICLFLPLPLLPLLPFSRLL
jgi:hypothetical protein